MKEGTETVLRSTAGWAGLIFMLFFAPVLMGFEFSLNDTEPEGRMVRLLYLAVLEIVLVLRIFRTTPARIPLFCLAVQDMVLFIVTILVLKFAAAGICIAASIPLSPYPGLSASAWFGLFMAGAVSILLLIAWLQDMLAFGMAELAMTFTTRKFSWQMAATFKGLLLVISCGLVVVLLETLLVNALPYLCITLAGFSPVISKLDLLMIRSSSLSPYQDLFIASGLGGAWILVSVLITRAEIALIRFAGLKIRIRMQNRI